MEIASAFGHLKAYHFENSDNLNESYAFLEVMEFKRWHAHCPQFVGHPLRVDALHNCNVSTSYL